MSNASVLGERNSKTSSMPPRSLGKVASFSLQTSQIEIWIQNWTYGRCWPIEKWLIQFHFNGRDRSLYFGGQILIFPVLGSVEGYKSYKHSLRCCGLFTLSDWAWGCVKNRAKMQSKPVSLGLKCCIGSSPRAISACLYFYFQI